MTAALPLEAYNGLTGTAMALDDVVAITGLLAKQDEGAFERVFKAHFKGLHAYAHTITRNEEAAEGIVQQVFLNLWEKAGALQIKSSVAAYLYRSVYNHSLNYLKHQKVRASYLQYASTYNQTGRENTSRKVLLTDLENQLQKALMQLPEQCRTIFQMSRFEDLKNYEIAQRLGISVKTVEAQMTKALKILRVELVDFLPVLLITLLY